MNCNTANEYMMAYFDKETDDIKNAQLKQHLKVCKSCSDEFEKINEIFVFLENDSEIEPPSGFENAVMDKINSHEEERKIKTDRILIAVYGFVTTAIAVVGAALFMNMKEINIYELMEELIGSFDSASSAYIVLGHLFSSMRELLAMITRVFFETLLTIVKTYFYVFIFTAAMGFGVRRLYLRFVRQDHGGAR